MIEGERFITRSREWQWFASLFGEHLPNVIQAMFGFANRDAHANRPDRTITTIRIAPSSVATNPQGQRPAAERRGNFGCRKFIRPRLADNNQIWRIECRGRRQVIHLPHDRS